MALIHVPLMWIWRREWDWIADFDGDEMIIVDQSNDESMWKAYYFRPWNYVRIDADVGKFVVNDWNGRLYIFCESGIVRRVEYCDECYRAYTLRMMDEFDVGAKNMELECGSSRLYSDILLRCVVPFLEHDDIVGLGLVNLRMFRAFCLNFKKNKVLFLRNESWVIRKLKNDHILYLFPNGVCCGSSLCRERNRDRCVKDLHYNYVASIIRKIYGFGMMPERCEPSGVCNFFKVGM